MPEQRLGKSKRLRARREAAIADRIARIERMLQRDHKHYHKTLENLTSITATLQALLGIHRTLAAFLGLPVTDETSPAETLRPRRDYIR